MITTKYDGLTVSDRDVWFVYDTYLLLGEQAIGFVYADSDSGASCELFYAGCNAGYRYHLTMAEAIQDVVDYYRDH